MKNLVCFDVDGTILDEDHWFEERWNFAWQKYRTAFSKECIAEFWRIYKKQGPTYRYHIDELIALYPEVEKYKDRLIQAFKSRLITEKKMKLVKEAILNLRNDPRFALAIISSGDYHVQVDRLSRSSLLNHFELIICDKKFQKPDPAPFRKVKFSYKAGKYFYIGNEPEVDFKGAKLEGFTTLFYDNHSRVRSNRWIDKRFSDFSNLNEILNEYI